VKKVKGIYKTQSQTGISYTELILDPAKHCTHSRLFTAQMLITQNWYKTKT